MYDGSSLPYEENVKRTAIITALAHGMGCSVEGELGHVGQADHEDDADTDLYTDPDLAMDFVEKTGIDALAVAIGTAHGAYPKGKIPKLDFERLHLLKETLNMPLVLHGGSGSGEENLRKAVAGGINKINVCTDAFEAGKKGHAYGDWAESGDRLYASLHGGGSRDQTVCKGLYEGDRFQRKIYIWRSKAGRK